MQCPHKCIRGGICCNNFVTSVDFQLVEHYMWWMIARVRLVMRLFVAMLPPVVITAISRQVHAYKFAQGFVVSVFTKLEINECDFATSPFIGVKSILTIQMGYMTTNEDIWHGENSFSIEANSKFVQTANCQVSQEEGSWMATCMQGSRADQKTDAT